MFSTKMVCLIQKLFGRDENSAATQPDLLSSLEIDCAAATRRPRQSEPMDDFCGQSNCPNRQSAANITPSESDGPSSNASPQSHHRSRSVSIPATCRIAFAKQDASSAPKLPSACSSSSSLSWSEDRLLCSRPVSRGAMGAAEPVCCCDACMYILDSSTLPFIAHQDTSPYSLPPAYDQVIGYTQPLLSGFLPTAASFPSNSSTTSCIKSESSQTSAVAVRPFHYEKTPHRTKQQQQQQPTIQSLPPMISISPDGEEGFANSQRILQHGRHYKKPFCEVPPNKTICHVHWKSINSK